MEFIHGVRKSSIERQLMAEKTAALIGVATDQLIKEYHEKLEQILRAKTTEISNKLEEEGETELAALLDEINYAYSESAWMELRAKGYSLEYIEPSFRGSLAPIQEEMEYKLQNIKVRLTRTIVKLIAEV